MPEVRQAGTSAETSAVRRFLTFRLGRHLYALPAEFVAEVILVPEVARVPESPPALRGIANLRGAVLPVASLSGLLGKAEPALDASAKAIVLDVGAPVALVVDGVEALVTIESGRIETREAELGADAGELLSGAFEAGAGQGVAKILDIKRLLDAAFARRARPQRQSTGAAAREQLSAASVEQFEMLVTFEVAGQEFALALNAVQEILPVPATLAAVPRAEALVVGVTSLRDKLLPLLSLRGLLGLPAAPHSDGDAREKVVVMKVGGAQVGLIADRARAVMAAESSRIDPIPAVLAARTGGESRIKAIYRGEGGRRLVSILTPEQLFREDVMQRLGRESAAQEQQAVPGESLRQSQSQGELQFLVFRLGNDEFGLPIDSVDEVTQLPDKVTRVPKTPKFLEGVVNLRGDVLPVVDQRRRFDMPAYDRPEARRLVVVRTQGTHGHRAGIIVDGVSDVLRVAADAVEPAPDLTEQTARLVRGVINLERSKRIVLVLDPMELLTPAERGLLDVFQKTGQAHG